MGSDLVQAHAHGHRLSAPERGPAKLGVSERPQALVGARASLAHQFEDAAQSAGTHVGERGLRRGQAITWQSLHRDRERVFITAARGILDLRGVPELDGDGVSKKITQTPLAVPGALERRVVAPYEQADELAVRNLREIKDPRRLCSTRRLSCRR